MVEAVGGWWSRWRFGVFVVVVVLGLRLSLVIERFGIWKRGLCLSRELSTQCRLTSLVVRCSAARLPKAGPSAILSAQRSNIWLLNISCCGFSAGAPVQQTRRRCESCGAI